MKRSLLVFLVLMVSMVTITRAEETFLEYGRFGKVSLYQGSPQPAHVVLFVSGDGGWNLGVVDMARELATLNVLVVGIDIIHFFRELEKTGESCSYPAADFEMLSKFVQKKLNFPRYLVPVLVGYSSGATLVYATLAQAPPNTFCGAISLGFCPDLLLTKPLCKGYGLEWKIGSKGKGYTFLPASDLQAPWVALQGTIDQVCDPASTENYVKKVKGGEIVILPKVGHGFSVPKNWMPQFKEAFLRIVAKDKTAQLRERESISLKDLPLVEVPAQGLQAHNVLAVIMSGDGGWAGIDRDIANTLSRKGVSVVGLNSLQYFWKQRTPEESSQDLGRILQHYLGQWGKKRVILIGYSLGADVLPFMANRLPKEVLDQVSLIAFLGLGEKVDFEFHLAYWLNGSPGKNARPVLPEVGKLRGKKILCFCGDQETDSLCHKLGTSLAETIILKGGHHFGGDYEGIAETILKESRTPDERP